MRLEKIKKSKLMNIRGQWVLEKQPLNVGDLIENINGDRFKILNWYDSKNHYRDMFLLKKIDSPNKDFEFEFHAVNIVNSDNWFKVF